jgi:hypothetical protein
MAVTHQPIFSQTPKLGLVGLAAANATRDGSGTIATAYTAGSNGAYIKRVVFTSAQATAAASSAMVGHVFVSIDAGATWQLKAEVAITPVTASNTAIGATATISFTDGLQIPASALIGVTISVYAGVQDRMQVVVEGGDY